VKKKVKEQADVKKFIEQETFMKEHSESYCPERNFVIFTAEPRFSSDYCDFTAQISDCLCHFLNPLVVADTVYHKKGYADFLILISHGVNIKITAQRRKGSIALREYLWFNDLRR
jgi:hypothetical protein